MNKYIYKTLILSALALPVLTSCELDQVPDNSLPTEETWQKVSDAENYYVGLKALLRGNTGGSQFVVPEVQSDLFNARAGAALLNQTHSWSFTSGAFDGDGIWAGSYNMISNANNVINNIGNIKVEAGSDDEATLRMIKGTAYFTRAYSYSVLVPRYCENYDAAKAGEQLGLPLVYTVNVAEKPSRSSLADTYKQIKADIDSARVLLADANLGIDAPNIDAVNALDARVSLYMNDYDNAIAKAKEIIDAGNYPLETSADELQALWTNDESTETIYQPTVTVDELNSSLNTYYTEDDEPNEAKNPYYFPTKGLMDLYGITDWRKDIYFTQALLSANGQLNEGYYFSKFPGNPSFLSKGKYNMVKVFRSAELYLIAAEASYKKNGTGADYLNELRTHRGLEATNATGADLWREIQEEWTREYAGEGVRLNNLKRWGLGFTRMEPQQFQNPMLITTPGYTDLKVEASNYKFIWEIPHNDLQANPNLEHNWK